MEGLLEAVEECWILKEGVDGMRTTNPKVAEKHSVRQAYLRLQDQPL